MMSYMYNNIKGVVKLLCAVSLLLSVASCKEGTDEEFTDKFNDIDNMNIQPSSFNFSITFPDGNAEGQPDSMIIVYDRVLQSWRGGYIQSFETNPFDATSYTGRGHFVNPEDSSFVKARYNLLAFTYSPDDFDYTNTLAFINREDNSSIFDFPLTYKLENGSVYEPKKIISTMNNCNNFWISRYSNGMPIVMSPVLLTQHFEYTFYIFKTDPVACVDAVEVEVEGVPRSIDLRTGVADVSQLCSVRAEGVLKHKDSYTSGRDTVTVKFDVPTVVRPSDRGNILNPNDVRCGYMTVKLFIRSKNAKGVESTKPGYVRYKMTDLLTFREETENDTVDCYTINKDKRHLNLNIGAVHHHTISSDILINSDTITSTSYGLWNVVKK